MLKHIKLSELNLNEIAELEADIRLKLSVEYGFVELKCISSSSKSQVWLMETDEKILVVKKHSEPINYYSEKFAYILLEGANIPDFIRGYDDEKIIILQFLQGNSITQNLENCREATQQLAFLHSIGRRNIEKILRDENKSTYFEKIYLMLGGLSEELNINNVRFSVGDIKPEHIITCSGEIYFIDLETFSFGCDEIFDLVSLWLNTVGRDSTMSYLVQLIDLYLSSLNNDCKLERQELEKRIKLEIIPRIEDSYV